MKFKVKDLMIDLSSGQPNPNCNPTAIVCHPTVICHLACSVLPTLICQFYCSHLPSVCPVATHVTVTCQYGSLTIPVTNTITIAQATPQYSGEALGNLKDQLKQALAAAEQQESAEAEALQPQTVADAEMLEQKLGEALTELRTRKAELAKKK